MTETRKASHLRILQHGPSGPSDYYAVKYLVDSGLADAHIRLSYLQEDYGQVVDVVWIGATASGQDYIEELAVDHVPYDVAGEHHKYQQPRLNADRAVEPPKNHSDRLKQALGKTSTQVLLVIGGIIVTVMGSVADNAVTRFLSLHFEFFR
ncbi:hypothetical protein MIH18_23600 (plasmid) [Marinobacter sp. M3C]|uniref:hypothetical protein n=1 Tax=Marinobacter sp. M3C TaxID=2917715 RepID=UPI00200F6AEA|nr:hypothetical protein [Marinobacter sp. M3C]MCL1485157.1 hypothetical protein [Marinobacter sp.]UQG62818.1 hypothetical protein MIH18_23600 [Marinobacter sp. M3C]